MGNSLILLGRQGWQSHCTDARTMRRSGGFTMIEMMMVVAVLGILATVAVVAYTRIVRKARSGEVPVIFGELRTREDAYHAENGKYLPACGSATTAAADQDCAEGDYWPTPLPGKGEAMNATGAMPARWQTLHVHLDRGSLYCQYEVVAGLASNSANLGTYGQKLFGATAPARNWFYVVSQCDWDGDPLINAMYWQRDDLSIIGSDNEQR